MESISTQGRTLEETRENLHEAIELILVSNREFAEVIRHYPNRKTLKK